MTSEPRIKMTVLAEYHADSLGAPFKVILLNSVRQIIDTKQGRIEKIVIPNERGLYQQIALARILVPRRLSGFEIKFIRKAVPIKASSLAKKLGISPEHLSRCEAGERALAASGEKCLRIAILLELFRVPVELQHRREQSELLNRKLVVFARAMEEIRSIIDEMTIPIVFDASEELRFYFTAVQKADGDLFNQDLAADWTQERREAA